MAKKKILTDNGQEILPITHEDCVLDNNGVSIGSKIGNINELATDSRTDLVSAINDILEFKDNMKQDLVNALINQGIFGSTSESWESLIDKIQQIEGSGGESGGIRYAEGTSTMPNSVNCYYPSHLSTSPGRSVAEIEINLDFTPVIIFCKIKSFTFKNLSNNLTNGPTVSTGIIVSNTISPICWTSSYATKIGLELVDNNKFILYAEAAKGFQSTISTNTDIEWYAIGQGESSGGSGGGGLDIISATELPATGKENQICVITDNPTENFIVSAYHSDISALDTSSIGVYLNDEMGVYHNTKVSMTNGGTTTNYYINRVCQGDNRLASYIYNNSQWNSLTLASYPVLESGVKITTHVGTLPVYSSYVNYTEGTGLKLTNGSGGTCAITTGSKLLDFDSLSKAKVTVKNETSAGCVLYIGVCSTPSIGDAGDGSYYINMITTRGSLDLSNITSATYTIDLSKVTGVGYLAIALGSSTSSKYLYITDLTLY